MIKKAIAAAMITMHPIPEAIMRGVIFLGLMLPLTRVYRLVVVRFFLDVGFFKKMGCLQRLQVILCAVKVSGILYRASQFLHSTVLGTLDMIDCGLHSFHSSR